MIKNGENKYFTYSNLKTVFVKRHDFVKKNELIATILKSDWNNMNALDIIIMDGLKKLSETRILEYINQMSCEVFGNYIL